MDSKFLDLLWRHRLYIPTVRVLALDPGETTGVAVFRNGSLIKHDQLRTNNLNTCPLIIQDLVREVSPDYIVMEDYKVYGWKKDQHAWAGLHTPQLLGVIRTIAVLEDVHLETRMAQEAKVFCTDTKLEEWGMYKPGMKHARDAIRHGCFSYLFSKHRLFNKPKES